MHNTKTDWSDFPLPLVFGTICSAVGCFHQTVYLGAWVYELKVQEKVEVAHFQKYLTCWVTDWRVETPTARQPPIKLAIQSPCHGHPDIYRGERVYMDDY